jgi:hypothetical protein
MADDPRFTELLYPEPPIFRLPTSTKGSASATRMPSPAEQNRGRSARGIRVVAIGGGTGFLHSAQRLKQYTVRTGEVLPLALTSQISPRWSQ